MIDPIAPLRMICGLMSLAFAFIGIWNATRDRYDRAAYWMGLAIWMGVTGQ